MMPLNDQLREKILRAMVARKQGWDITGLSVKEILGELYATDREAWRDLIGSLVRDNPDPDREAHIRQVRQFDQVDYHGDLEVPSDKTFENFHAREDSPSVLAALEAVRRWAHGKGLPPHLLTLSGPPGVGKTHLALAAAQVVLHRDQSVIYCTEKGLLDELHHSMRGEGPSELVQEYGEIPWLVLDDLGAGAVSEWDKTQIDQLINMRWEGARAAKRTLVTTNLVGPAMTPRIASRLGDVQVGLSVLIRAPDYRLGQ